MLKKIKFIPIDTFLGCEWGNTENSDMPVYAEINGSKVYFNDVDDLHVAIWENQKKHYPELAKFLDIKTAMNDYTFKLCVTQEFGFGLVAFHADDRNAISQSIQFVDRLDGEDTYVFVQWNENHQSYDLKFPNNHSQIMVSLEKLKVVLEVYLNH